MPNKEKARELWNMLSAVLEAGCVTTEEMKPLLLDIKRLFGDTPIGKYVNEIIFKGSDASMINLDSIRHLLHEEWDDTIKRSNLRDAIEMKYGA